MSRVKAALDNEGKSPLAVCLEFKMNDWQGTAELLREVYKVRVGLLYCTMMCGDSCLSVCLSVSRWTSSLSCTPQLESCIN